MMTVKLLTSQGEFVAEVEIPAFDKWPEVLIWGVRTFVLRSEIPAVPEYGEVFAFVVP